ncbi:response regulator [Marinobacterium sp. YM272]|uniref:response regulator n=1 Tax=Marinobacterium sp. YM272 TaxID=3421654 RepID=UPI003D7FCB76
MSAPIPVVICDDSPLARKQMIRALSPWNLDITQVSHGLEALEAVRAGKGHLLFLDLNMPIMDGYQCLERIRSQDLPGLVVVVSGDIQEEARKRVMALGAIGFIRKPINTQNLHDALAAYGILNELEELPEETETRPANLSGETLALQDYYQELSNVAMGQAAEKLARLQGAFIEIPVPRVRLIDGEEIAEMLDDLRIDSRRTETLCQGFLGPGIAGEAILTFDRHSLEDMSRLMQVNEEPTPSLRREMLMSVANVLISAYLVSLGDQLDVRFSQSPPVILGTHYHMPSAAHLKEVRTSLSIEVGYRLEGYDISSKLLLLFTEDSLQTLNERTRYL